jgi:predicted ferric reductase
MQNSSEIYDENIIPLQSVLLLIFSSAAGALLAVNILPVLVPGFLSSVNGEGLKAFWYLSRSSAFAAYLLLWLSMAFGLLITNRMAKLWPGGPAAFDLHQHVSLLALVFSLFHALILLGDQYIQSDLMDILIPFGLMAYRPFWVGFGQIGLFLLALVTLTFYVRKWLGGQRWRVIHMASYAAFVLAAFHGLYSGTDTLSSGALAMYTITFLSVFFLTMYRILSRFLVPQRETVASVAATHRDIK